MMIDRSVEMMNEHMMEIIAERMAAMRKYPWREHLIELSNEFIMMICRITLS